MKFRQINVALFGVFSLLPTALRAKKVSVPENGSPQEDMHEESQIELPPHKERRFVSRHSQQMLAPFFTEKTTRGPSVLESVLELPFISVNRQLMRQEKRAIANQTPWWLNGVSPASLHSVSVLNVSVLETLVQGTSSFGWQLWALIGLGVLLGLLLLCFMQSRSSQSSSCAGRQDSKVDLQECLTEAIAAEDGNTLELVLEGIKNSSKGRAQVPETLLAEAEAVLERQKAEDILRRQLAEAMARRDVEELRIALAASELCTLSMPHLEKARNLLQELEEKQAIAAKPEETGKE